MLAALPADEKRAILGGAGSIVIDASDAGTDGSSQLAEHAVKAAMMAITLSQTYASALAARLSPAWKDQDDHFAYLIYRGLGGRAIGRPIWAGQDGRGFLSREMLLEWVKLAVAHDTTSSSSTVGRMLKEQGGARLHDSFR